MNNKTLISVVVPVYNVERYLPKCIESICEQTYSNIEIILIDDGSTDECGNICDRFESLDSRIRVIHKKNGGLSDARNCGINNAHGDLIFFVDSDDTICKETLEIMYNKMLANDADMVICNFDIVDETGAKKGTQYSPMKDEEMTPERLLKLYNQPYGFYYIVAWNKLYHKRLFDNIRFPVGKRNEDQFVAHKIAFECEKIITVKRPLYHYTKRENSIMHSSVSSCIFNESEALGERCKFIYDKKLYACLNEAFRNFYLNYYWKRRDFGSQFSDTIEEMDEFYDETFKYCKDHLSNLNSIVFSMSSKFLDFYIFKYKSKHLLCAIKWKLKTLFANIKWRIKKW